VLTHSIAIGVYGNRNSAEYVHPDQSVRGFRKVDHLRVEFLLELRDLHGS
jgi:hypothetical protein